MRNARSAFRWGFLAVLLCFPAILVSAGTRTWNTDANGLWTDANNWTPLGVPGVFGQSTDDDVVIDRAGVSPVVTLDGEDAFVRSLACTEPLVLQDATLRVRADSSISGAVQAWESQLQAWNGATLTLSNLIDLDNTDLEADGGSTIAAPLMTTWARTGTMPIQWDATDAGTLDLGSLALVNTNSARLTVRALNDSHVNLGGLSTILHNSAGSMTVIADANSSVDLSAVSAWTGGITEIEVGADSTVLWNNPTMLSNTDLTLETDSANLAVLQIAGFRNGDLTVVNATGHDFSNLTDANDSHLVANGGTLFLPGLTRYASLGGGTPVNGFRASNGGTLSAPNLETVHIEYIATEIFAGSGGTVNLQNLSNLDIVSGKVSISAGGEGSVVDLTGLSADPLGFVTIEAREGGTVRLPDRVILGNGASWVRLWGDGTIDTDELVLRGGVAGAELTVSEGARLDADVVAEEGDVRFVWEDRLTLGGDLTVAADGQVKMNVRRYSQTGTSSIEVIGTADLAGTLTLNSRGDYIGWGDRIRVIEADSISGTFDKIDAHISFADSDALSLAVVYEPNAVDVVVAWAGDANLDGKVSLADLSTLAGNWGTTEGGTWETGDLNQDGMVSLADLSILAANWGDGWAAAPAAAVPEPASFVVISLGCLALLMRRRR
ncbi:MAG: hypothetical protein ACLFV7_01485 [Phycisphaerae bacterium]